MDCLIDEDAPGAKGFSALQTRPPTRRRAPARVHPLTAPTGSRCARTRPRRGPGRGAPAPSTRRADLRGGATPMCWKHLWQCSKYCTNTVTVESNQSQKAIINTTSGPASCSPPAAVQPGVPSCALACLPRQRRAHPRRPFRHLASQPLLSDVHEGRKREMRTWRKNSVSSQTNKYCASYATLVQQTECIPVVRRRVVDGGSPTTRRERSGGRGSSEEGRNR